MPTSAFTSGLGNSPLSVLRASPPTLSLEAARPNEHMITPMSLYSIGTDLVGAGVSVFTSATYTTNRVAAVPFQIAAPFVVRKVFWFNGTTATTDSADVGVYTEAGALMVSGGGTAISGANSLQEVDVTDTVLKPGRYWLAYSQNGATATPIEVTGNAFLTRMLGCAQASGYPLGSTFTPAALSSAGQVPLIGIASRTLAA